MLRAVLDRIDEYSRDRIPNWLVMDPAMWERLQLELRYLDYLNGSYSAFRSALPYGLQCMVVLDFGDEIVCAYDGK